jgi:hypothetical protein
MPSESLHDTTPHEADSSTHDSEASQVDADQKIEIPVDLSEFSQRLASFGLGEAPDPLLTEARPPSKRRRRA